MIRSKFLSKVQSSGLRSDKAQLRFAEILDSLDAQPVSRWRPDEEERRPVQLLLSRLLPGPLPQGVYCYGSVGTGKTLVMDTYHQVHSERSTRKHFHEFMLQVHSHMRNGTLEQVADHLASSSSILCLDEMQVTDVADAVILHRLFRAILARKIKVVATSNRRPEDLYKNGINRQALFVPFEKLLLNRFHQVDMNQIGQGMDYRAWKMSNMKEEQLGINTVRANVNDSPVRKTPRRISVGMGRWLNVPHLDETGVAYMTFESLCVEPKGSSDYLALCDHIHTLVLDSCPARFTHALNNEARRFTNLVDVLYDRHVNLVLKNHIDTDLDGLFSGLDLPMLQEHAQELKLLDEGGSSGRTTTLLSDQLEWSATGRKGASLAELSNVQDVSFAYKRAVSRLKHMRTRDYFDKSQATLPM